MKQATRAILLLIFSMNIQIHATQDLDLSALLAIVVETGTFLEIDPDLIPASVVNIDRERIESANARDLRGLLEIYVPSYQSLFNRWNGWLMSMNGVTADVNSKILVLIDGREVTSQSRDGAVGLLTSIDLNFIERVEVLEGNAGFVYGAGAIGGVINIIPKRDIDSKGSVLYSLGAYREDQFDQRASFLFSQSIGDVDMSGGFSYRHSDGVGRNHSYIAGLDGWGGDIDWEPIFPKEARPAQGSFGRIPGNYHTYLNFSLNEWNWYTHFSREVITASGAFVLDPFPIMNGAWNLDEVRDLYSDDYYGPSNPYFDYWHLTEAWGSSNRMYVYDMLMSSLERTLSFDNFDVELLVSYANYNNTVDAEDFTDIGLYGYPEYDTSEISGEQSLAFKSAVTGSIGDDLLHYAYGYQHRTDFIGTGLAGENSIDQSDKKVFADTTFFSNALFAEGLYKLTDQIRLHGGVRVDHHSAVGASLSPKTAFIYSPAEDHYFHLIYQQATNNPTAEASTGSYYVKNDDNVLQEEDFFQNPDREPDANTTVLPGVSQDALEDMDPEVARQLVLMTNNSWGDLSVRNIFSYNMMDGLFMWDSDTYKTIATEGQYNYVLNNTIVEYDIPRAGLSLGVSHNFNRIVNTDISDGNTVVERRRYDRDDEENPWYDNIGTDDDPYYIPVWNTGEYDTTVVNAIQNTITQDGTYFLNTSPHLTKLYADYQMNDIVSFHLNSQLYWKRMLGRKDIYDDPQGTGATWFDPYDRDVSMGYRKSTWDVERKLSARLNVGVHFDIPFTQVDLISSGRVSLMGDNILGHRWTDNYDRWDRNTAIPYYMSSPGDGGLFRAEQAMFRGTIRLDF
ncbi:TonB-dependent receptor plug domain-containing protein [Chitinivibrio alkaliphilus]|uniref:TonB-dependent receptor plug domain-containing protein n=1 Tax=Chitinivibrio alkaliphilus ACht1 TaxID=1313304 RepID=U7D991_9BACT|nr:TonB-dependent receptor plug domain-containing protein [Chitinivibrio alkaliphilus]ERP30970.1 hypothetical protein CALK_2165 [Chitinivibrio alkaliphilus ACht1]